MADPFQELRQFPSGPTWCVCDVGPAGQLEQPTGDCLFHGDAETARQQLAEPDQSRYAHPM